MCLLLQNLTKPLRQRLCCYSLLNTKYDTYDTHVSSSSYVVLLFITQHQV